MTLLKLLNEGTCMSGDIHCTNRLSFCKTLEGCYSVSTSELLGILEMSFLSLA